MSLHKFRFIGHKSIVATVVTSCLPVRAIMEDLENITSNTNEEKPVGTPDLTPIQKFFVNTNVFLTGATGFIGILLLQKLLASCPGISKIYLLVRAKKGKDMQTRMEELFDSDVFSRLKTQYPNFRKKIVLVEGDCELPRLGLNAQDKETLIREVDVVFHGAATVRFDEALKKASMINVRAVKDMIELARQMPNLKSFIHISTAFSNSIHNFIKEEIYPPVMDYKKLLSVTESLPDDILTTITKPLLGDFPNTYAYTKKIGEDVVRQEGKGLPLGVHRPSIVMSTYREPIRGWINNLYGPAGLSVGMGVGLIRVIQLDLGVIANVVPADMVVNSVIASAWEVAENFTKEGGSVGEVPVYNFEISRGANLTWYNFMKKGMSYAPKYATAMAIWHMFNICCRTDHAYAFLAFFLHTIPAALVDAVRFCLRKPPMMLAVYRKITKTEKALNFFKLREWTFQSKNVDGLISKMSEEDRRIFFCDVKDLDWDEYMEYLISGFRVYLLGDPLETIPEGQKLRKRLYWIHQFTKAFISILFLWILKWTFSPILKYIF